MKSPSDHPSQQQLLDQLVDGQLAGEGYRDLLRALEADPDGWKRCALAFLEEQALRQELGVILAPTASAPTAATVAGTQTTACPALPHSTWRAGWLAVAAAVLASFGLGLLVRGAFAPSNSSTTVPVATAPESKALPEAASETPADHGAAGVADNVVANDAETAAPSIDELTVVVGEGDQQQTFRLPVSEVDTVDQEYLNRQQWTFTTATQQALAEQGLHGTSRRGFVPIDLGDGRQMIVPVEEVVIQPLAYQ